MDAACRVQNEAVWPHLPKNLARGEKSTKDGRRHREKYDCGDATSFASHERGEKNLVARNLGDVPAPPERSNFQIPISNFQKNLKSQNYWTAKIAYHQRVALSGGESKTRSDPGGNFAGIRVIIKNLSFLAKLGIINSRK